MHLINKRLITLLVGLLAGPVGAQVSPLSYSEPGSLLIFPEYDNRENNLTLLTVTNTNADVNSEIRVEFVYIARYGAMGQDIGCLEYNLTHTLTALDTLSVITSAHSLDQSQGFVYAFAKDDTGAAVAFDYLVGDSLRIDGIDTLENSQGAFAFQASVPAGSPTDVDEDGIRDLDGAEYAMAPDQILIPRFLGQGNAYRSDLILIGLSGGRLFDTTADFLIYNDNEQQFSDEYTFRCWDRVRLTAISGSFGELFLDGTNQDRAEIIGASDREAGWFRVTGGVASSNAESILDPAILAVLVERVGTGAASALPFTTGTRPNGDLFPVGPVGDGPDFEDGDNQ